MKSTNLCKEFGVEINSADGHYKLNQLDIEEIIRLYKERGVVFFRGFNVGVNEFKEFSTNFIVDEMLNGNPARKNLVGVDSVQEVNVEGINIPFHSENAFIPFRPQILFFYCENPSLKGGQTTFCDGVTVYRDMSTKYKELFEQYRITYVSENVDPVLAKMFYGKNFDLNCLQSKLNGIENLEYSQEENGYYTIKYTESALIPCRHLNSISFSNALLTEYYMAYFENGAPITEEQRMYLFQLCVQKCVLLNWKKGDFVMVDNCRIMHGRVAFSDKNRKLYNVMGNESF